MRNEREAKTSANRLGPPPSPPYPITAYCDVVVIGMASVVTANNVIKVDAGVQVESVAVVVQVTVIAPEKPPLGVNVARVEVPKPAMTLPEVGARLTLKSTPLPSSARP